jgi:hypothetical protein
VPHRSRFVCAIAFSLVNAFAGYGQISTPSSPETTVSPVTCFLASWEVSLFQPVLHFFKALFEQAPAKPEQAAAPAFPLGPCSVAPLDPIVDPAAEQLESATGSDVVNVQGMVPAAARALDRFVAKVEGAGGTIVLKSAYRPAAYQQHLQNVWYKWMDELRNNTEPGCQGLRAQVREEFTRHRLIETQHPVAVSDHTRGLAFDATVDLPSRAKIGKRRMTLDGVARLAGLIRPAIAADPVHFKFLGGMPTVVIARNSGGGTRTVAFRRRRNA